MTQQYQITCEGFVGFLKFSVKVTSLVFNRCDKMKRRLNAYVVDSEILICVKNIVKLMFIGPCIIAIVDE